MCRSVPLIACVLALGCSRPATLGSFDRSPFENRRFNTILAFDLRGDRPRGAVLVGLDSLPEGELGLIVLPFGTVSVDYLADIALATGSYPEFTVLSFARLSGSGGTQAMSFDPVYEAQLPESFDTPGRTLYFAADNQERTFAYLLLPARQGSARARAEALATRSIDAVAVAIPADARRLEVSDSAPYVDTNEPVRFYQPHAAPSGQQRVIVRYLVPLTSVQQIVAGFLLKLFGLITPPLIAIALLRGDEVTRPALRKAVLISAVAIESIVIAGVVYYSLTIGGQTSLQLALDGVAVTIAAVLTVLGLVLKKGAGKGS